MQTLEAPHGLKRRVTVFAEPPNCTTITTLRNSYTPYIHASKIPPIRMSHLNARPSQTNRGRRFDVFSWLYLGHDHLFSPAVSVTFLLCRHSLLAPATPPHPDDQADDQAGGSSEENTKTSAKPLDDSRMEDVTWRISTSPLHVRNPPPGFAVSTVGESCDACEAKPGHQPLFISSLTTSTHPLLAPPYCRGPLRSLNCRPRDSLRGEEGLVS